MKRRWTVPLLIATFLLGLVLSARAAGVDLSRGQVVYVPVYSEIPFAEGKKAVPLAATLSVRNTDRQNPITIRRVDYYDAAGRLVRAYLTAPRPLAPLSSLEFILKESERRGGISESFLVEWGSERQTVQPMIEAVMIGTRSGQGISFSTQARVIEQR